MAGASTVPERLVPVVEAGNIPALVVPGSGRRARGLYDAQAPRQGDEAMRTAIFGTAATIYAAHSLGLCSTPMIGFDADAVHREFGLGAR